MIEGVSRRTLAGSSGTYNVRATELAVDRGRLKSINAVVVFLDDTQHCFKLDKRAKGQALLEAVFQHLELIEKDYFGLQFTDNGLVPSAANTDLLRWLNPKKSVKKQMRGGLFYFRVKFYVSDPSKLQEEYTRYHLYLQLRKDILLGKLLVSPSTACLLASYTVQSELGDYHPEEHKPGYISGMILVPGQTEQMEKKISDLHKLHKGQSPADAEFNYLDHGKRLEMYGVDLHKAKDSGEKELDIGVTCNGLVVFQNNIRINTLSWAKIVKISFKRRHFFVQLRRELSENYDTVLGFNMMTYRSSKNLWKSCVEHHSFFRLNQPVCPPNNRGIRRLLPGPLQFGSRFSFSGRTEIQTIEDSRISQQRPHRTFLRFSSRCTSKQSPHVNNNVDTNKAAKAIVRCSTLRGSHDNKVTSVDKDPPRPAWGPGSDDEGGFIPSVARPSSSSSGGANGNTIPANGRSTTNYVDDDMSSSIYDIPAYDTESSLGGDNNVVCIHMCADNQGRFGFNVRGGSDLGMPIVVSRVVPNTSAYRAQPKLCEGDQVLMINGQEVSDMVHDDVVNLIRAARDLEHDGKLILTVQQKCSDDDCFKEKEEEPLFQYVPDSPGNVMSSDPLLQSILLLGDGLASGSLLTQFEQLYRHKPGALMDCARAAPNIHKNRYRDIAPYDCTRYVLKDQENDYINANYINMEIPGSGIINRYIATQGPLQTTIGDFWQMVLESRSNLIVMVTALVEKGRQKCAKYWPPINETLEVKHDLTVKTVSEETETSNIIVYRQLELTDLMTNETRPVTQIQYGLWPDHGVPDDSDRLLSLVDAVRKERAGVVEPVVVHCSAGIGRTGVIILLETALCLLEAGQPVYPLEIVRQMRDQRAMMVQTSNQYKFVCSCIHYAFTQGIVQPLPEYSQQ
ncbi:tyrosine-protein phosphatase non-receptor type 4 [Adelges cooleyi]|uniref:tyrosine-protein phosphatase non-receptor type 4 n=1 Tax=Adelges cooleyi TaxID=133065 RepID=UPI00217F55B2|nr:tyrosine-protein phosphatase non-receptor type 4 [Adelges cooleyi]XP_050438871.1 tyrosine-protein phosphatase non-receptor type 4 [Adelges cooleyi]